MASEVENKIDQLSVEDQVNEILKYQSVSDEDIEKLSKYYDVNKHDVHDTSKRKDRKQRNVYTENGEEVVKDLEDHKVNRVAVSEPKKIVDMAVSFAAGNPLNVEYIGDNTEQIKAIQTVLHNNKELPLNRRMCRALFAFREVAEIWYRDFEDYTDVRCHLVSPMFGDKLYPNIDRFGKMQGFGYSNTFKEGEDEIEELTYYTKEFITRYRKINDKWGIYDQKRNVEEKITVVYTNQGKADYEDVISSIDRRNLAISNLGDSVDDSAYPSKVFKGQTEGVMHVPGEGSQYKVDVDGDVKIVESQQATSLIQLDLDTNKNIIYTQTETADLSLENLKGLGNGLSGETLKRMLTGSILKVQNKREYLDEHYQRRYNIINHMVCYNKAWNPKALIISCEVVPYVPEDEDAELDRLRKMIGLMPIQYILKQFKERIDSSIDEEEILGWIEKEKKEDVGGSWI